MLRKNSTQTESVRQLGKCSAYIHEYNVENMQDGDDYIGVQVGKTWTVYKNVKLLRSYSTQICAICTLPDGLNIIELYPYAWKNGTSMSRTTTQHLSKFCKLNNIPFLSKKYRDNLTDYFLDTNIPVILVNEYMYL